MSELRHCRVCKWVKPADAFYPYQGGECKECTRKRVKQKRMEKIDYYRAYDRERGKLPHRVANTKRVVTAWKQRHPQRRAAQVALGNAVRDGRVQPWPCMVCGARAEAHHPCYDMPLDVVWLCPPHHKQAHAMVR